MVERTRERAVGVEALTVIPAGYERGASGLLAGLSRAQMATRRLGEIVERLQEHGRQLAREFAVYEEVRAELVELGVRVETDFDPWVLHGLSVWKTEQQRAAATRERREAAAAAVRWPGWPGEASPER